MRIVVVVVEVEDHEVAVPDVHEEQPREVVLHVCHGPKRPMFLGFHHPSSSGVYLCQEEKVLWIRMVELLWMEQVEVDAV